jgi:hypothetical protein
MEIFLRLFQGISYSTIFFVGMAIRVFIGMRQFNRRGLGGLQHFNNYFVWLITLLMERLLKWIALILILWGAWGWLMK